MFKRGENGGIMVGRFEYSAHISAFLLLFLAISAFEGAAAKLIPGLMAGPVAIGLGLAFILSLLLHEAGHAYTAVALGVPIKGIKLFALGGMAMMSDRPRKASTEFLIAIAGPLVSAALWILMSLPVWFGAHGVVPTLVATLGFYNLAIAIFNMIPAFPLDGGRVFRSIVWGICGKPLLATKIAVRVSELIVAAYLIFSFMSIAQVGFNIIWNVVISFFVVFAGEMELRMLKDEGYE